MVRLDNLTHVTRNIEGGGSVLVLDTGAAITPPAQAMLAALHSRSVGGIREHLEVLDKKGFEKFMKTYYVGYGHKSIGDCGSITVFIEGISMLAAKAIQDFRLYDGQEASTRYIDFSKQDFINPVGLKTGRDILEYQRTFYLKGLEILKPYLAAEFPLKEKGREVAHTKMLDARAFDIMRAFLPAGASTNLAWHGKIRIFGDRLPELRNHPLAEVRNIATALHEALYEAFPDSFQEPGKIYRETEKYIAKYMGLSYYDEPKSFSFELTRNELREKNFSPEVKSLLKERPNGKTELPKWLEGLGQIQFKFLLDFGSFRDVQRHRAVIQRMPILNMNHGFEPWYLKQMPEDLKEEAVEHLRVLEDRLEDLSVDPALLQYYIPMGYRCTNCITGGLPALVYLIELRSQSTVHPTLRVIAQRMGSELGGMFKDLALYYDKSEDHLDIRRGEQDIVINEDA
ncbi:FAD-dependent thymidylate synthase [Candidatus Wolfebacteria bacterium]|nr:FAD-dependent thymidylate synthase [Candidatus Wolfebacteria bacterium]